jgi:hypothetical protein
MCRNHTQHCTYSHPQTSEPDTSDHVPLSPPYLPPATMKAWSKRTRLLIPRVEDLVPGHHQRLMVNFSYVFDWPPWCPEANRF